MSLSEIAPILSAIAAMIAAGISAAIALMLSRKARLQRISEFQITRLAELREHFSKLYGAQYELGVIKRIRSNDEKIGLKQRRRELQSTVLERRAYLLSMIDDQSSEPLDRELERLLKAGVAGSSEELRANRLKVRDFVRSILWREWRHAMSQIER